MNRRKNVSDDQLCKIIENELNTSLSCVSYCQMTETLCLKYGVNVAKGDFRKALTSVDPDKVNKRKSKIIVRREYLSSGRVENLVFMDAWLVLAESCFGSL